MPEPTPKFAPGQRLKFDPERALWREVGDELVIFEVPTTTYLTLNSAARTLWKHLADGASPVELTAELVATYAIAEDVGGTRCRAVPRGARSALSAFAGRMTSPGTTQPWAPGDNPLGSRATRPLRVGPFGNGNRQISTL